MKKIFFTILGTLLISSLTSNGMNAISGSVNCDGEPMADILVTDGYNFSKSDRNGDYSIEVADSAQFVSIITPAGYTTDFTSGVPSFYQPLDSTKNAGYDFKLNHWGNADTYALVTIGDMQFANDKHFDRFSSTVFPDIKEFIQTEYLDKDIKPVLVTLGDISWDNFNLYDDYLKVIEQLPAPLYPVIGNHDHDKKTVADDYQASHAYNQYFGPNYYGFNLGDDYYIVLDIIIYDTNKRYAEDLDQRQQAWLKKYLTYIPRGSKVYICMHSPIMGENKVLVQHYQEWLPLFSEYDLSIISGHTHLLFNKETIEGVYEHNVGAACGTWWTADTGRDGAPIGYQLFESKSKGEPAQWRYKSVGHNLDYQIKLYGIGTVKEHPESVVAYIWGVDDNWDIKGWYDNSPVEAEHTTMANPDYTAYVDSVGGVPAYKKPYSSDAYFTFKRDSANRKAKTFRIEATDSFGNKYTQSIEL